MSKKPAAAEPDSIKLPDPMAISQAMMSVYQKAQPVFEATMRKMGAELGTQPFDPMNMSPLYIEFMERLMANPDKVIELQQGFWNDWIHLWQESGKKFLGEHSKPVIEPDKGDRRFKAAEWQDNSLFDFIKQSYLLTCQWMDKTVRDTEGLDPAKRQKLAFATRLFADALSPTNFVMTNPEVLKETIRTGGDNLIKGLENLVSDLERGKGELKISTTDYDAFEIGRNIATTPGKVVYQNDLMQLLQYEPATADVFKTPLLIIPPWINKYYILDLREDNSLIRWAVEQGHTVFAVSWVNPDIKLASKRFEDYMQEGIIDTLDAIKRITGETDCNVIGYCLGGTLLTITMSYLKSKGQSERIKSATLLTTLLDFEHAGDLKLFMDDEQLALMDREMAEKGVLQAKQLQRTFSLLRSNDLIWSFVVNNYLMGKEPFPFDLLYWNDDSTNMPAAMHSFYLRKLYRDNLLTQPGGIEMKDQAIDITAIKTPAYFLSTREDHIAPWKATYAGSHVIGGESVFTLAASGHIAGIVNHPDKKKYCYWTSSKHPKEAETWLDGAKMHEGSWWPHWQNWIKPHAGKMVKARKINKFIEPAPGSYVKVKSV
jgi:polyhydroxyalkanoate synthase